MSKSNGKTKKATAAGVTFEWQIQGTVLQGRMTAATLGWVTVGFNRARELRGTRLIMGYVKNGRTVVEEHLADPPNHRPITAMGGRNAVRSCRGTESGRTTTIGFELDLDSGDKASVPLVEGQRYYVTFAWSHEDDLDHHSAERTAIELVL